MPMLLTVRYDLAALQPPDPADARHASALQTNSTWSGLRAWCLAGSGPGTRPLWRPGAAPRITTPWAVATLNGPDAESLARALCLERDGSLQLMACQGAAGRVALRLQTKLHDALWWRARQPTDAWDSGTLRPTPDGLAALRRFTPRRPTLLVAQGLPPHSLRGVAHDLQQRQPRFTHPVRLLLVSTDMQWPGATVFDTAGAAQRG